MMRRLFWISLAVVGLIGCSSTEPEPAQPPDVKGQYAATFTFHLLRTTGFELTVPCDCTINIVTQTGGRFTGSAAFAGGACAGTAPFSGTIEVDGSLEAGLGYGLLGSECIKRLAPPLTGTFSGGTITAQTTEEYTCSGPGYDATLDISLSATRR